MGISFANAEWLAEGTRSTVAFARTWLRVTHLLRLLPFIRDPFYERLFEVELLEHALHVAAADVRHHEALGQERSHEAGQRALGDVGRMQPIAMDGGWRQE